MQHPTPAQIADETIFLLQDSGGDQYFGEAVTKLQHSEQCAWHARQAGVTIFTVGYGSAVDNSECAILAQVANAVNVVTPAGTDGNGNPLTATNANSYITGQPVGQQYYATTPDDISNDFYEVGTAISGALTQ